MAAQIDELPPALATERAQTNPSPELQLNPHIPHIEHPKAYSAITPPMILASFRALQELNLIGQCIPKSRNSSFLKAAADLLIAHGFLSTLDTGDGVFYMLTSKGEAYLENYGVVEAVHSTYAQVMATVEEVAGLESEVDAQPFSMKQYFDHEGPIEQTQLDAWLVPALSLLELIKDNDGKSAASILVAGKPLDINALNLHSEEAREEFTAFMKILEVAGLLTINQSGVCRPSQNRMKRRVFHLAGFSLLALSYYQVMQELDKLISGEKKYGLREDLYRQAEMNAHASNADMAIAVGPKLTNILNGTDQFDGFEGEINPETIIDYGSGGGEVLMRFVDGVPAIQKGYGIDFNPLTVNAAELIAEKRGFKDSIDYHHGSITEEEDLEAVKAAIEADGLKPGIANISAIMHDVGHKAAKKFLKLHAKVFGDTPLIITEAMRIPLDAKTARPDYRPTAFEFMHGISLQELFAESEMLQLLEKCGYKILGVKKYSSIPSADGEEKLTVGVSLLVQHVGR